MFMVDVMFKIFGNVIVRSTDELTTDRFGFIEATESFIRVEGSFIFDACSHKYVQSKGVFFYPLSNIIEIEHSKQWRPEDRFLDPEVLKALEIGDLRLSDFHPKINPAQIGHYLCH
jgi:hypothetical protein